MIARRIDGVCMVDEKIRVWVDRSVGLRVRV